MDGRFIARPLPILLGVLLTSSVAPAQPLGYTFGRLVVQDAHGRRIGQVRGGSTFASGDHPAVAFLTRSGIIVVGVGKTTLAGSATGPHFTTAECTGTPFVAPVASRDGYQDSALPLVAIGPPGQTIYRQTAAPTHLVTRSPASAGR